MFNCGTDLHEFLNRFQLPLNFQYMQAYMQAENKLNELKHKSIVDGTFKFKDWQTIFPIETAPTLRNLEFLPLNASNASRLIQFYKSVEPGSQKQQFLTFQRKEVAIYILNMVSNSYFDLTIDMRINVWSCLIGWWFDVNSSGFENNLVKETDCLKFLDQEVEKGRITQISEILHGKFICAKYFSIEEEKFDMVNKVFYKKFRHVADATVFNEFISPLAQDFAYNFPNAASLFRSEEYFGKLMSSVRATVVDKSEFYRDLLVLPNEFSYVVDTSGRIFLDCRAKMGMCLAPAFSQMTANLLDYFYNKGSDGFMLTLQDDSLILQDEFCFLKLKQLLKFNKSWGFCLNEKKTQLNKQCVEWSGWMLDFSSKEIFLPKKKVEKIEDLITKVQSTTVTRRTIASLLGKLYSASLMLNSWGLNFSSICLRTRNLMFWKSSKFYDFLKDKWFFDKEMLKTQYREFFDTTLPLPSKDVISEVCSFSCYVT